MDFTEFKAFDNLNTEIIILDGDNFQLLWINDAAKAANWIGDSSKFTEKTISSLLDKETGFQINEILKKTRENTGSVTKRDFEIVHKSGNSRTVDLTITFSEKKNLIFIEAVSIDNLNKIIDSTKTFSTQKIAANLARTLAHEVKNPLSGIRGSAQILSKKLTDDYSEKFLKIIIDETDRLNSIVTKILTPPSKPNLSMFNIHSALEKVYALAEADKENKIDLIRDYDPSIPEINGDENLFVQAILNIVKNAQQAIENIEDPSITIKSRIEYGKPINGVVHQTVCSIEIIDNGPGIPQELHDQVFFPMVSVKENGSGLGLTIAQDIIRIHGGGIIFRSNPGETIFAIQIPIKIEDKEAKIA